MINLFKLMIGLMKRTKVIVPVKGVFRIAWACKAHELSTKAKVRCRFKKRLVVSFSSLETLKSFLTFESENRKDLEKKNPERESGCHLMASLCLMLSDIKAVLSH